MTDAALVAAMAAIQPLTRQGEDYIWRPVHKAWAAMGEAREEIKRLRAALTLAEDVLSRSPFSTQLWPNGTHPNAGIEIIREALK